MISQTAEKPLRELYSDLSNAKTPEERLQIQKLIEEKASTSFHSSNPPGIEGGFGPGHKYYYYHI